MGPFVPNNVEVREPVYVRINAMKSRGWSEKEWLYHKVKKKGEDMCQQPFKLIKKHCY